MELPAPSGKASLHYRPSDAAATLSATAARPGASPPSSCIISGWARARGTGPAALEALEVRYCIILSH